MSPNAEMLEEVCVDGRISYGTQRTRTLRVRSRKAARDDQEASIPVCYVRVSYFLLLSSPTAALDALCTRTLMLPLTSTLWRLLCTHSVSLICIR